MLGTIFLLEWHTASRRSRHRRLRALYTGVVVIEFCIFLYGWLWRAIEAWAGGRQDLAAAVAALGETYLWLFAIQHFAVVLLLTPALAAGSVSEEKARGTLTLLLTTRMTTAEFIVGKCLGQALQVLVLTLPAVPLLTFLQVLGGQSPAACAAWAAESVLIALLLAALSLTASVWATRTTTAIMAVYLFLAAGLCLAWLTGYDAALADALWVQLAHGDVNGARLGVMALVAALTALCLLVAAWRLRSACAAQGTTRPRRRWLAWFARPPVGDAPMRWKERYVGELGLLGAARKVPRWLTVAAAFGLGLLAAALLPGDEVVFVVHGVAMIAVVGLLVAVRSSGAISRERERHTWEPLLLTPLEAYTLVRGKLWGIVDSVKPYLVAYLVGILVWSIPNGVWAVSCTISCWLATWTVLYFESANGLYQSVQSTSSWKSLGLTLLSGLTAPLLRAMLAALLASVVGGMLLLPWLVGFWPGIEKDMGVVSGAFVVVFVPVFSALLFADAEHILVQAERHIATRERTLQDKATSSLSYQRALPVDTAIRT